MKFFKVSETNHSLNIDFFVPGAANALSLEAARELKVLIKKHAKIKKPVIVESRHPRVFCSGGNLSDHKKQKGKAPGLKANREITAVLDAFGRWPVPKLALIEGDVLGGGLEWLARFDFRWSSPNAYFVFWQKRIGLSSGWGGGRAWSEKIGEDQVRRLLMESRHLSAHSARALGLIDRVVCSWRLHEEAKRWSENMASDVTIKLGKWSAARETMLFNSMWMGPVHSKALRAWRA